MGLIARALAPVVGRKVAPTFPQSGLAWLPTGPGLPGESDYRARIGDGDETSIVSACVNWIARTFPEAPPMLERRDRGGVWSRVDDHDLLRLLDRPNPFYPGTLLWSGILTSYLVAGNGYALKARPSPGARPRELYFTPHWMLEPRWPTNGSAYMTHYDYAPMGAATPKDPRDVLHLRYGLDPRNVRKGRTPFHGQWREVYTDEAAARYTSALLSNQAMPGVVISPDTADAQPSQEEMEAVKSKFVERFSGNNLGAPIVLSGPTKLHQFGYSPAQMLMNDLRDIPEERITAAIGLPAAVAGLGTGLQSTKTNATMKELRQLAWDACLIPIGRMLAEEVRTQLFPDFGIPVDGTWRFGWDYTNVRALADDETALVSRMTQAFLAGGIERAEYRGRLGFPVTPSDRVFYVPMGVLPTPVGRMPAPPEAALPSGTPPKALGDGRIDHKATEADRAHVLRLEREARRLVVLFTAQLADVFGDLGDRVAAAFRDVEKSAGAGATKQGDDLVVRLVMDAADVASFARDELRGTFERYYAVVGEVTYRSVSERTGVAVGWNLADEAARRVVATGGTRAGLVDVVGSTRDALYAALADARAAGEGPPVAARRIRQYVPAGRFTAMEADTPGSGVRYRSVMIARTETKFAQNTASMGYGDQAGFDRYVLFDARIGPTDEECELRDGRVVGAEEAQRAVAEEHPNGSLSISPMPRT